MVGIGLIFTSLAVIRLNEHVDALEQSQKVFHDWIVVDNGGMRSNEVFKAVFKAVNGLVTNSTPQPKE